MVFDTIVHNMRQFFGLVVAGLIVGTLVVSQGSAQAAGEQFDIASEYDISETGAATVRHIFSITNTTNEATLGSLTVPVIGKDVGNISAAAQDGGSVTAQASEDGTAINLTLPDFSGEGRQWSFSVSYSSHALTEFGASKVIQIPRLDLSDHTISRQTANISADLRFGFAIVRGPEPASSRISLGKQILTYTNENGALDTSLMLLFGETTTVEATLTTTLKNDSLWYAAKTITLPPDTNQQQVFLSSLEPQPSSVRLDADGNILAEYKIAPKKSVEITAKALIRVNSLKYQLDSKQGVADVDPILADRYTSESAHWKKTEENTQLPEGATAMEIIEALYNDAVAHANLAQLNNFSPNDREGSMKAVDGLVGALRSKGIPARVVLGTVASDGNVLLTNGPQPSAWVEAFVPGSGWITLDPLFDSHGKYFGTRDIMHVALGLWGIDDDFPPIDLAAWDISYSTKEFPETNEAQPMLSAKKYMILPGISLLRATVTMPQGSILDGTALKTKDGLIKLGSLSPLQILKNQNVRFGGGAFNTETIEFGLLENDTLISLAAADSSTSYMVMLLGIGGIVVLVAAYFGGTRAYRRMKRDKPSRETVRMHEELRGGDVEEQDLVGDATAPVAPQSVRGAKMVEEEDLFRPSAPRPQSPPQASASPKKRRVSLKRRPESPSPQPTTVPPEANGGTIRQTIQEKVASEAAKDDDFTPRRPKNII